MSDATATSPPAMLVDVHEAARLLSVSPRYVQMLASDGTLPCVRLGRLIRFDPQDLARWIERQKQAAK